MLLDKVDRIVDEYLPKEWVRGSSLIPRFVRIGAFLFLLYIVYQLFRFVKCTWL